MAHTYFNTRDAALAAFLADGGFVWTRWRMTDLEHEEFSYHNTAAVREAVGQYQHARPGIVTLGELMARSVVDAACISC